MKRRPPVPVSNMSPRCIEKHVAGHRETAPGGMYRCWVALVHAGRQVGPVKGQRCSVRWHTRRWRRARPLIWHEQQQLEHFPIFAGVFLLLLFALFFAFLLFSSSILFDNLARFWSLFCLWMPNDVNTFRDPVSCSERFAFVCGWYWVGYQSIIEETDTPFLGPFLLFLCFAFSTVGDNRTTDLCSFILSCRVLFSGF